MEINRNRMTEFFIFPSSDMYTIANNDPSKIHCMDLPIPPSTPCTSPWWMIPHAKNPLSDFFKPDMFS